jgi:hypothetical protein
MVGRVNRVAGGIVQKEWQQRPRRDAPATDWSARSTGTPSIWRCTTWACDDVDQAFDPIMLLAEQRHPFLMMVVVGGPYGEVLRSSPRWPGFARTIGLM